MPVKGDVDLMFFSKTHQTWSHAQLSRRSDSLCPKRLRLLEALVQFGIRVVFPEIQCVRIDIDASIVEFPADGSEMLGRSIQAPSSDLFPKLLRFRAILPGAHGGSSRLRIARWTICNSVRLLTAVRSSGRNRALRLQLRRKQFANRSPTLFHRADHIFDRIGASSRHRAKAVGAYPELNAINLLP